MVPLEPVRSAEPPISTGTAATRASSTFCEDWRVASLGFSAMNPAMVFAIVAAIVAPVSVSIGSARRAMAALPSLAARVSQAVRASPPRAPAARQAASTGAGTSNGACGQPSFSRARAISSAPSGSPCVLAVPCLVGAPKPMMVFAAISVGLSDVCAAFRAVRIAAGSWPSTRTAAQPEASKRRTWSSPTARLVAPSIEIELSSNSTISLAKRRWPASEIASCEIPSIRQPSPAIT